MRSNGCNGQDRVAFLFLEQAITMSNDLGLHWNLSPNRHSMLTQEQRARCTVSWSLFSGAT